jgi:hypothetical protein
MQFGGWFLVNVAVPLTLPVVGILPLQLLALPDPAGHLRVMATVKDGQLCWAVIAMGTATLDDLWQGIIGHRQIPDWSGGALAGVIVAMVAGGLLAAGGAAFNTPLLPPPPATPVQWIRRYRLFSFSVALTAIVAIIHTALYVSLPDACAF